MTKFFNKWHLPQISWSFKNYRVNIQQLNPQKGTVFASFGLSKMEREDELLTGLKDEVMNIFYNLIDENPNNRAVLLKIIDVIQKDKDNEFPFKEFDVEGYDDDKIIFSDGLILVQVVKQDDKYIGTIEGAWFNSPNEEPVQIPFPKISESYDNVFNAIFQIMNLRWDIIKRYYRPFRLNRMRNIEELYRNPLFEEWRKVTFYERGLVGLDYIDVWKAVEDKVCKISHMSTLSLDFDSNLIDLPEKVSNILIAIKLPKNHEIDSIHKVAEKFVDKVDPDCQVLWQSIHHDKNEIEIIYLYN